MFATSASRVRVSTLNNVDLPTFGRPTRATTGSMIVTGTRILEAAIVAHDCGERECARAEDWTTENTENTEKETRSIFCFARTSSCSLRVLRGQILCWCSLRRDDASPKTDSRYPL